MRMEAFGSQTGELLEQPGFEVVYFRTMADKTPTVAVLNERLTTAISLGKWFIGAVVAVLVTVGGFFFVKISDHGEKLAKMQVLLESISTEQKKAIPATLKDLLQDPSRGKLEAATAILGAARKTGRLSDPALLAKESEALGKFGERLVSTPEYWNVASELISYRSEQTPKETALKQCSDNKQPTRYAENVIGTGKPQEVLTAPPEYYYCEVTLDSAAATEMYALAVPMSVRFHHCVIVYNGGNIEVPIRPNISNDGPLLLVFHDCQFRFRNKDLPPETARHLITGLLSTPDLAEANVRVG